MGITTLEMDLAITKDRKVILSHDAFLSPELVTKPNGKYIPRDSGFITKSMICLTQRFRLMM